MKRASIILIFFLVTASICNAQSIVVDTVVQTSFCAGSPVVIPYKLPGGDFNIGNIFTAQLSSEPDLIQNFPCPFENFDNPIDIGILPYWGEAVMFGQIPDSLTLGSYSIRIIASNPPDTSTVSSNCIVITNLPEIIFMIVGDPSDDTLCQGDSVELSVTPLPVTYQWSTGETSESIWVKQSGSYTVTARDTVGCETESDPYTVEFETCVGIEDQGAVVVNLGVQPIPASDELELVFTSTEAAQVDVYVYNLLGEEVLTLQLETGVGVNRHQMDISSFKNGLYLVKVGGDNSFGAVKMIKN